ncbi:CpsD/CapB family tyrosine-protein kinase [Polyangium aurulentum]|uniref:CpsD/CapB family tyrosine-protein kinase n=1 Tax=Polyangium aurulentum TaxID=2567896 RepID=UPI0010AE84CF|nr:CpsD/CapB family tyrosine-protein kinase [Polyangium aurulentum]UQA56650.1 CpsD/CapB family tyrosine-protein kinase [Polyangium aurulentum]
MSTNRIYRSETTVMYRDAVRAGREGESPSARASKMGPRLKELVLARPRLTAVIEEMGLYPEIVQRSMLLAVDEMQKNISFRARTQDTFVISFSHQDPATAQKVTARLAEVMIEDYSKDGLEAASATHDFMKRELEEADKSVEDASRSLARFLARHPQFTWGINDSPYAPTAPQPAAGIQLRRPPVVPNGPPPDPVIVQLNQRLAQIDTELAGGKPGGAPAAGAPAPATAGDAQRQRDAAAAALAAAETELRTRLVRLTPAHPDAMAAKSKVDGARAALAAAENNLRLMRTGAAVPPPPDPVAVAAIDPQRRDELERERRTITGQLAARRSALAKTSAVAPGSTPTVAEQNAAMDEANKDVVELETEWHKLRLDLERARDHFRKVQDKERVASLSVAAAERESQEELVVVDPAYVPVRPDKGRGRVFFAGSFVALFFALGFAGARVMLNDTLFDEGDVEAVGGPPLIVALPHISAQGEVDAPPSSTLVTMPASSSFDGPYSPYSPYSPPRAHVPPPPSAPAPSAEDTMPPMTAPPAAQRVIHLGPTEEEQGESSVRLDVNQVEAWLSEQQNAIEAEEPTMQSGVGTPRNAPPASASNVEGAVGAEEEKPAPLSLRPPPGPVLIDEPSVEVVGLPFDPASEGAIEMLRGAPLPALGALRVLRHRLEKLRQGKPLVVSVVSPGENEGKSSVATRLAMTLAEAERARVVLVEGNLARPRLAQMLGLRVPEEMGMSAQIRRRHAGRWEPWNVIRIGASLFVLAEPGPEASFPGALHSTWFEAAIRALRESYDYVVIDGCPVLASGDANVLEEVSDSVILLARSGVTRASALSRAARQLGDRRVFGVVLNDVSAKRSRKKGGERA